MRSALPALLLLGLAAFGCSDPERLNPVAVDGGAGAGAPDGGSGGAGPVKRTVVVRNPFGDVKETENLLWDGDFEWFSAFSDEYGWLNGPVATSFTFTGVQIGPQCRSGLKCVSVAPQAAILGIGVASKGNKLEASFWVVPPGDNCEGVRSFVVSGFATQPMDPEVEIKPTSKRPGPDGWCHFDSVVAPRTEKPVLFIQNQASGPLGKPILVDDCVLKVAPSDADTAAPGMNDDKMAEHVRLARVSLSRWRKPHDPPPSAARSAFEAWKSSSRSSRR